MLKKTIILLLALLAFLPDSFCNDSPVGQWDGNAGLNAGSGFVTGMSSRKFTYSSGDISAWGRYRTDKFSIRLNLQCLSKFTTSSVSGVTVNIKDTTAPQGDLEVNHSESPVFSGSLGLQTEFTPDAKNSFSFNFKQKIGRMDPQRVVISMHNIFNKDDYSDVRTVSFFDIEEGWRNDMESSAQAKWVHKFDKTGRVLTSEAGWSLDKDDDYSLWNRLSSEPVPGAAVADYVSLVDSYNHLDGAGLSGRTFRFTPLDKTNGFRASVRYNDVDLFGQNSLNLELGAELRMIYDRDRLSAANCVNDVWTDSLAYRRDFDYLSMNLSPAAKLSYSPGKFSFALLLIPDFYASRLDSDGNRGRFNFGKVFLLPDLSAIWTPSASHKAGISYKQGVVRPTYLQVCPFRRIGANATEIQTGNPELRPGGSGVASLFYTFHSGFFTGTLEGNGKISWDRIDKAFSREGEYRIYTWFNSGRSFENSIKLTLKADLESFNAEIGGYYNYFIGNNNVGDPTRSSDWGVNGNAVLRIRRGWVFDVRGRYQSKIIRTYTSITEYIGCDARITKNFKRFLVYVEGKDLFDRPIMITTYSADKTYAHFEERYYNRRIFSIGASFKF